MESEGTKKDYIYINKVSEIISRIITEPQKNFFEVKEVKSGKVFSVLDIVAHINFHISIIDLVPKKLKDLINERTKKLNMIFEKNKDIDEQAFSNEILSTINWIKKIN